MDEPEEPLNRGRKLEARARRRDHQGGRSHLHAMTNSRVRRAKAALKNASHHRSGQEPADGPKPEDKPLRHKA